MKSAGMRRTPNASRLRTPSIATRRAEDRRALPVLACEAPQIVGAALGGVHFVKIRRTISVPRPAVPFAISSGRERRRSLIFLEDGSRTRFSERIFIEGDNRALLSIVHGLIRELEVFVE